jgi:hypothetical protein
MESMKYSTGIFAERQYFVVWKYCRLDMLLGRHGEAKESKLLGCRCELPLLVHVKFSWFFQPTVLSAGNRLICFAHLLMDHRRLFLVLSHFSSAPTNQGR